MPQNHVTWKNNLPSVNVLVGHLKKYTGIAVCYGYCYGDNLSTVI